VIEQALPAPVLRPSGRRFRTIQDRPKDLPGIPGQFIIAKLRLAPPRRMAGLAAE